MSLFFYHKKKITCSFKSKIGGNYLLSFFFYFWCCNSAVSSCTWWYETTDCLKYNKIIDMLTCISSGSFTFFLRFSSCFLYQFFLFTLRAISNVFFMCHRCWWIWCCLYVFLLYILPFMMMLAEDFGWRIFFPVR